MSWWFYRKNKKTGKYYWTSVYIDILVLMIVIGLLAALVGPKLFSRLGKGKQSAAKAQIELLGQALKRFKHDTGRYPSTSEGLDSLIKNLGVEGWEGPYLKKTVIPRDPWNRLYEYKSPGIHGDYDLYSYGADGLPGGEGLDKDIFSWK